MAYYTLLEGSRYRDASCDKSRLIILLRYILIDIFVMLSLKNSRSIKATSIVKQYLFYERYSMFLPEKRVFESVIN